MLEREQMNPEKTLSAARIAIVSLSLALVVSGCKSTSPATDDASLNAQVQARLSSDQNLAGQPIQATVASGVVTLNGSVSSDSARTIASGDAAQVAGVKTVVNNLVVQQPPPPAAVASMPPQEPVHPAKSSKPPAAITH